MPVSLISDEDKLTAVLSGEIDHHHAKEIREEVDTVLLRQKPRELCFDFRDVSFMDSSGIGLIMGRYRICATYGGKVSIINTSAYLRRVMRLSGIDELVNFPKSNEGSDNVICRTAPKKEEL